MMTRTSLIAVAVAASMFGASTAFVASSLAQPQARGIGQSLQQQTARIPDPLQQLQYENDALTKRVATLEAKIAAAESNINDLAAGKENRHQHAGYSSAFTTKLNWNRESDNAAIEYWTPNK
jgi:uncharacterized protein YlxW (UPF0749 family)